MGEGMTIRYDDESHAYHRNHTKLRRHRGSASRYDCELCGAKAQEWSQIHGTDGTDPHAHFRPLCKSCHLDYDRDEKGAKIIKSQVGVRRTTESKARMSAAQQHRFRDKPVTAETKAKAAEANRGHKHSDATKKKMAESRRAWWAKKKADDT